jgi:MscS family membrane protein
MNAADRAVPPKRNRPKHWLPAFMFPLIQEVTAMDVNLWKAWLPSLTILVMTLVAYTLFRIISTRVIHFILDKLPDDADQNIATALYRPGRLAIIAGGLYFMLKSAPVDLPVLLPLMEKLMETLMIIAFHWVFYNFFSSTNYVFAFLTRTGKWHMDQTMGYFISMCLRILVIFFCVAGILSYWGFDISGFIAGLSIGGLAVSLAAKDSLSNIFACCIIMLDHPFRIGDWIVCNDIEGTVESISFRSTNVRTPLQGLVNIPNSMIISTPITNYSNRDRRRVEITLGVTYDTTREQMQDLVHDIRETLIEDPDIITEDISVAFTEMGSSSLNVNIICYTYRTTLSDFMKVKEEVNLRIMKVLEKLGISAAFPSQSVYMEKWPDPASKPAEPADQEKTTK